MSPGEPFVLAGADGCKAGWVLAGQTHGGRVRVEVVADVPAMLARVEGVLAVDMPIGLPDGVRFPFRPCDHEARLRLGPRRSSIFPAPLRAMLTAASHRAACDDGMARCGKGLSLQAWHLIPKIRELDDALTPQARARVIECHPELSFMAMNGGLPLSHSKKHPEGREARESLIARHVGPWEPHARHSGAGRDDVLDALAALWTARRHAAGCSTTMGDPSHRDERGLPMRIVW